MSTNNTGWVVTNGHHYITENSCKGLTDNVQEARFWKKEKSAQNILAQLQTKKKSPLVGFYVCFVGVNSKIVEMNNQHNPNNMMNDSSMSNPKTCVDMEKTQIANNIKDFLSDILGDNAYAKEIVGMHFHYNLKQDENAQTFSLEEIQTALAVLRHIANPNIKETLYKELSRVDMEIVDIEHKIEMSNFNAYEGYKLAKEMQVARRKRREIKDTLETLESIEEHKSSTALHNVINAVETKQAQRTYTPRIRQDLFEKK
jgi:DNA mismatch repair ATPase MutS